MPKIAAVIVTYNRREKLLSCIEAIKRQTSEVRPDIIVADNNSSDGTEELVRGLVDEGAAQAQDEAAVSGRIIYSNLRFNSGGAGGFCWGIRKAVEWGYDYLWLMDDDCVPAEDALEEFLQRGRELGDDYGFLSGKAIWRDGSLCRMNIQRETVFRNIRRMPAEPVRIEMASFVSLFLPARVVKDIGLPLREFYIWTDDWEYTRRISVKYPCWLVPSSVAMHDCEANSGADIASSHGERVRRFRYLYRNDVYLYRREGIRGFMYEAARLSLHAARITVSSGTVEEKKRKIGIMLKGTAEGLKFHPVPDRVLMPTADMAGESE